LITFKEIKEKKLQTNKTTQAETYFCNWNSSF